MKYLKIAALQTICIVARGVATSAQIVASMAYGAVVEECGSVDPHSATGVAVNAANQDFTSRTEDWN